MATAPWGFSCFLPHGAFKYMKTLITTLILIYMTGCTSIVYERDTFHQADEMQTVTDAKGNESAVPQETITAKSKGVFAKKDVKNFRFATTNAWDGTNYVQSKVISTESASSDVSEQTTEIVESAVKGAVEALSPAP